MNYSEKEYEEIFQSMLDDSVENGIISKAEDFKSFIANKQDISNYYVMDKAVIANMFAQVYDSITLVYNSAKVNYAELYDLDDIGDFIGIPRPPATYAEVICEFTVRGTVESDITISEGLQLSTDNNIYYETLEELYFTTETTTVTVSARAVEAGPASRIDKNTLTNINDSVSLALDVTNPEPSTDGYEAYSDDDYRDLLKNWTKVYIKGSNEAYENYFANVDGIDGYRLVPNWDSSGTMKVIVDPGSSSQLNQIYDDLQTIVTQAPEDIVMFAPEDKLIDIYATVDVDIDLINPYSKVEKDQIKDRIVSAIKLFIDGGMRSDIDNTYYPGLYIGEDFIPHKLAVFLDEEIPELKDINFQTPASYIQIKDDEIGVSNNIHIEMI